MSRSVEVFQVDAFTTRLFAGNPAGVVLGADALAPEEMQAIARELNNGDTAFISAPQAPDHDFTIRFFTPRAEASFVGHATLAAHAVLHAREPRALRRQRGRTGIVEVAALEGGARFRIRQAPAPLGRTPTPAELDEVLALSGLDRAQLDPACPPRIVGGGSTRLLIGLASATQLRDLEPRFEALGSLSAPLGAQGYFFFSRRDAADGGDTESRMFCPALGIAEDPVSGNAHAMLGHHLLANGLLAPRDGCARFTGMQGHHMARPGRVDVEVEVDAGGAAQAVSIAGSAVIVFQARIEL